LTIVESMVDVLKPFRNYTLWMSKHNTLTLHPVFTGFNDTFDCFEAGLRAFAKKTTQSDEDLYITAQ
jgi:hypothetical protein